MKGIIFNLLEIVVQQEHGEEAWDGLLEAARVDGAYTSLGDYGDGEFGKLVTAASATFGMTEDAVLRWFGRSAIPILAEKYPHFFKPSCTRDFLLTLNELIHAEVRKLYPRAVVPEFDYDTSSSDVLIMGYRSPRKLCALAEGFIEGAATHYGERVSVEQPRCMHRGDEKCVLTISFRKQQS